MKIRQVINPMYWANRLIDKRINNYGKGVGTEMKYNPLLVTMKNPYNDKHMTRRMLENGVLYSGIEQDIQYFYQTEAPKFWRSNQASESLNYFWASTNTNFRKIHSGFPQLISEKMVDLIVGNGYDFEIEGKNEEELKEELEEILVDNKFNVLLGKGIETESWSGGTTFKLSFNPLISQYPIIEVWQPENYTNKVVCGRIVEDIFFTYYEKDNIKYRLSEMYGVDKVGAYIEYKLHMLVFENAGQTQKDGTWVDAPLSALEQTKELKRISFVGYYKRLSLYKPNKLPNSEFRYTIIGESDYAGSYGAYDAIDEVLSTMIEEFRDSKLNKYFPEEYVPQTATGKSSLPDDFKVKHIIYADSPSENADKQKIIYEQGDLRIEKHIETYKMWVTQVLNNAGLSPLTVGITGLEAIDASAESQQEREKVSIRTRNKKVELWKEFLADFLQTTLEFRMITKNMKKNAIGNITVGMIPEFEVIPTFEDYILKSMKDRTTEVTEGKDTVWDTLSAVQYVHRDKTTKEQYTMSARIKLKNGDDLSIAEASALQSSNMQDMEDLKEDGVKELEIPENINGQPTVENDNTPQAGDTEV